MKKTHDILPWQECSKTQQALWRSENGSPVPKKVLLADDTLTADSAYKLACEGCGLLWQGDFQNARQLLIALARRCDRPDRSGKASKKAAKIKSDVELLPGHAFHLHRQAQSQRARILGMLLIPLNADYAIPLKRAPDITSACTVAYGEIAESTRDSIVSLRELLAVTSAYEWRKKGVFIPELQANIHPHFGVFSPLRGEYISLVANMTLPGTDLAFDIGTGTGVLAAVLAKRGVQRIVATDQDSRALHCARENIQQLGYSDQIDIIVADLFPEGKAPLIVCNPPWVPARPSSPIEHAIFDPESRMLRGFLTGLAQHLTVDGEGWLLLSDLAEHLGLRTRDELITWISEAGLRVVDRTDIKPNHSKAADITSALYPARAAEVTSLWRLVAISE